ALWVAAGCRVEVVTTTGAALRRAFSRVYGDRPAAAAPAAPAARTPAPGDMQARHSETVRKLTALRIASERVRHDLDAGARLLPGMERPSGEGSPPPAEPTPRPAPPLRPRD